jgi:sulfite reductase (NADPH) flavoprotein alpha-component
MAGDQKQIFLGRHAVNRKLTGPGSEKDTRHHEIAIETPATASYLPGDALGLHPRNPPALVERILRRLGATGDELVAVGDTAHPHPPMPLAQALIEIYNLTNPSRRLFELLVSRGSTDLAPLLDKANAEQLKHYLNGWNHSHDVLDVLESHPGIDITPAELAESLRKALPRLYSIASSLKAHPQQVDLLVVSVRYTIRDRVREGPTSTWLAERWPIGDPAEMYLQNQQKHFAMPASDTPLIMIGPGTGLAPFRAFIEERQITGARGRNWLFFGEQRRASDYFYEDEFVRHASNSFLRMDVAFSRDQAEKVYVQHRMEAAGRELFGWLEEGAELYVCGDKERMAADVDRTLHRIVETHGGRTPEQATEYIEHLRQTKRYKRDVY